MSGTGNRSVVTRRSGDGLIDGVLVGAHWDDDVIHYSFSLTANAYGALDHPFEILNAAQEAAVHFTLSATHGPAASAGFSFEGFTAQVVNFMGRTDTGNAHIRYGVDTGLDGGRVSDFPGDIVGTGTADDGDVWFGSELSWSGTEEFAQAGNAHWHLVLHETGHALGLKHGHQDFNGFDALPFNQDSYEFTVMTYRTFVGSSPHTLRHWQEVGDYDFPQTFMILDVAALQYLYDANFTINSDDTVYSWTPDSGDTLVNGDVGIDAAGNVIFATLWDGGGFDTYDLSAYFSDLIIDLTPGQGSVFSPDQLSHLGQNNFASASIYNALQYQGDIRSLIEMAIGGAGDDIFIGNDANNIFYGGQGDDRFDGAGGKYNQVNYEGSFADYIITQNSDGSFTVQHDIWGTDTLINIDGLRFADASAPIDLDDFGSGDLGAVVSRKKDVTGLSAEHVETPAPDVYNSDAEIESPFLDDFFI